jgi:hypothetical protein
MKRGRDVAVNAGDDVDRFELYKHLAANKHVVGKVVPHPTARIDHD